MTRRPSSRSAAVLSACRRADRCSRLLRVRARPLDAQRPGRRQRVQRLALPPDQLHPAGHRRPPVPARSWARRVGRSTLFGIPLQQQWSYANSGDFAPTYYLQSDAPLYYYSFTDAYIASVYRVADAGRAGALRSDDHRVQSRPTCTASITSAACCRPFPASSRGIGEFSIHKEFVSSKISGETASLTNPALDRILDFAAEAGLVVILHNDIDMPFAKTDAEPVYLTQMKALLKRHPKATIIWAHIGLGRIVHPVQVSAEAAERSRRSSRSSRRC